MRRNLRLVKALTAILFTTGPVGGPKAPGWAP